MDSNNDNRPYLHRIAERLRELIGSEHLVVLPNRRSLFVLKELTADLENVELPTIDDLMQHLSGRDFIEPEELLVSFYNAYSSREQDPQDFERFTSWAVTFLSDVNEIDLHLGDVEEIFDHIDAYHKTGQDLVYENAGSVERSFLSFWERLPGYYDALIKELDRVDLGYRGFVYRRVAEMAAAKDEKLQTYFNDRYVHWVGIVPGNPSERMLLEFVQQSDAKLELYADVDRYFSEAPQHEAGRLFRDYPLKGELLWRSDLLSTKKMLITVHPLPGVMTQVARCRAILDELGQEAWSDTVVVLPDPSFVLPIIHAFEDVKDRINITGGFPMRNTMIHRFVMSWLNLHAFAQRKRGQLHFYHKHLEEFMSFDVVRNWLSGSIDWDALKQDLVKNNIRYVPLQRLQDAMESDLFGQEAFDLLFDWDGDAGSVFQKINRVLEQWQAGIEKLSIARIERQAIKTYLQKLELMLSQFNELLPNDDIRGLKRFVHRQVGYTKLYLEEPNNKAVQVMGMLETRMIDFKHVIFLGASDDHMPGPRRETTHLPLIHRLHFKLPSFRDTEALNAYHFYRLLQRAEQVHLIYDSVGDEMTSGEPSRYIIQLQEELLRTNEHVTWKEEPYAFQVTEADYRPPSVSKTEAVLESTREFLQRGISPSAINTFINSPLEFYFSYVLGIKEEEGVEEDIEASTFGNIVHEVLEKAYTPLIGETVNLQALRDFIQVSDERVETEFLKQFDETDVKTGRNLLKLEMAKEYVRSFIEFDIKEMEENGPVKILYLEPRLGNEIQIEGIPVKLKGFADRIDERNGITRIIDYKTGAVDPKDLKYHPTVFLTEPKLSKALQLALYQFMYCRNHRMPDHLVQPCIFSTRNFTEGYMPLTELEPGTLEESFTEFLTQLIRDILDPTQPFQHRSESKYVTI